MSLTKLCVQKSTYKRGPVVRELYTRALRNLPWVAHIWHDYLLVMEKDGDKLQSVS